MNEEVKRYDVRLDDLYTGERDYTDAHIADWWREVVLASAYDAIATENAALREENTRLRAGIEHIGEYWNGSYNERAMTDALDHIVAECVALTPAGESL